MSPATICYIDDETSVAKRYEERLSRWSDIECNSIPPPSWEEIEQLTTDPPDLFLVDYQLSLRQPSGAKAAYQGSTLADAIRDKASDCPIVLVTRQSILDELTPQRKRQLTERMQMFDELILKSSLDDELEKAHYLLLSMAEGFRVLRETEKTWEALVGVLGATAEEMEVLGEAAPPLATPPPEDTEWITTEMAYWIRKVVLEFPGILYDPIHAATRLGISKESFQSQEVQELLEPARYTGIFDPFEGRWWKGRLLRIAQDLALEADVHGPTRQAFADAFERVSGSQLTRATCVWDHTPIADRVCYVLSQPVKTKNSLRYHPDRRPDVMDNARVSFRAIRDAEKFNEAYLDPGGLRLLEDILELAEP
jgi:hypothetical protein